MNPTDLITVQNLRRRNGPARGRGFEAVRGVSFSVRRGELFALLGTNGAGTPSSRSSRVSPFRPPALSGCSATTHTAPAASSGPESGSCCRTPAFRLTSRSPGPGGCGPGH
jgi:hypothetical protein